MFYSSDLLVFRKGKFGLIWLAATRGGKFISRKDLIQVSIHKSCKEIIDIMHVESKMRFSLYLSSQLTYGLCIIYNRKLDTLLFDLKDLLRKASVTFPGLSKEPNKRKRKRNEVQDDSTLISSFVELNPNFGVLELLNFALQPETIDFNNQFEYLNQARFEDITMVDPDYPMTMNEKTQENDLEPLNIDILKDLLAVGSQNKVNDSSEPILEQLKDMSDINRPSLSNLNLHSVTENMITDDNVQITESAPPPMDNQTILDNVQDKNGIPSEMQNNQIPERMECNPIVDQENIYQNAPQAEVIPTRNEKVSSAIEEVVVSTKRKPKARIAVKRNRFKQIIDKTTIISHETIRENMANSNLLIMDKSSVFPNAKISKYLPYRIKCNATDLLRFPGRLETLASKSLTETWMKRLYIGQNHALKGCPVTESNINNVPDNANIPIEVPVEVPAEVPVHNVVESVPAIETMNKERISKIDKSISIEKFRETSTSTIMNIGDDSSTRINDSFRKSIRRTGDTDIGEINMPPQNLEEIQSQSIIEPSMLAITEETEKQPEQSRTLDFDVIDKNNVWNCLVKKLEAEYERTKDWKNTSISFYDICPKGETKKNASLIFMILLRLGKYNKIKLTQNDSTYFDISFPNA